MADEFSNVADISKRINKHLGDQTKVLNSIERGVDSLAKHFNQSLADAVKKTDDKIGEDVGKQTNDYIEKSYIGTFRSFGSKIFSLFRKDTISKSINEHTLKTAKVIGNYLTGYNKTIVDSASGGWKKYITDKTKMGLSSSIKDTTIKQNSVWSNMWKKFADKEGEAVESFKDAFNDAKTIIQSEFENLMGPEIMKIYTLAKSSFKSLWNGFRTFGSMFKRDKLKEPKIEESATTKAVNIETEIFKDLYDHLSGGAKKSLLPNISGQQGWWSAKTIEPTIDIEKTKDNLAGKIKSIATAFLAYVTVNKLADEREGGEKKGLLSKLKGMSSGLFSFIGGLIGPIFSMLGSGIKLIFSLMKNPTVLAFLYLGFILYKAFSGWNDKEVNNIFGGDGILSKIGSAIAGAISGITFGMVSTKDVATAMMMFGQMVSESWMDLTNWATNINWMKPFTGLSNMIGDGFNWLFEKMIGFIPDWARGWFGLPTKKQQDEQKVKDEQKAKVSGTVTAPVVGSGMSGGGGASRGFTASTSTPASTSSIGKSASTSASASTSSIGKSASTSASASTSSIGKSASTSTPASTQSILPSANNISNKLSQTLQTADISVGGLAVTKNEMLNSPIKESSNNIIKAEDEKAKVENEKDKKSVDEFGKMVSENTNNNINTSNAVLQASTTIDESSQPQHDIPISMPMPFALINS